MPRVEFRGINSDVESEGLLNWNKQQHLMLMDIDSCVNNYNGIGLGIWRLGNAKA